TRTAYQALVTGQGPLYYFKLDGSLVDSVSNTVAFTATNATAGFTTNVFGDLGSAYEADTSSGALYVSDIIPGGGPGANTSANGVGSLSLLFYMLSANNNTGQRYIFFQGTSTSTRNAGSLFIENNNVANGDPNALKLR